MCGSPGAITPWLQHPPGRFQSHSVACSCTACSTSGEEEWHTLQLFAADTRRTAAYSWHTVWLEGASDTSPLAAMAHHWMVHPIMRLEVGAHMPT